MSSVGGAVVDHHLSYDSFADWCAAIGCPTPDPDLFRRLARGNGARLLRLLVRYCHPVQTVTGIQSALTLHTVRDLPDHQVGGRRCRVPYCNIMIRSGSIPKAPISWRSFVDRTQRPSPSSDS